MKRLILTLGLLGTIGMGAVLYFQDTIIDKDEVLALSKSNLNNHEKVTKDEATNSQVSQNVDPIVQAQTIEELENNFSGLSNGELEAKIKINNRVAADANLFHLANSGQLDEALSIQMVQYIRVNRVLHQILLNRQIEEIERDIL